MDQNERPIILSPKIDTAPSCASAYLDPTYWDQRFSSEEHYEWFKDYSHFQHLIQQHIPPTISSAVLELGSGNSKLCEDLFNDGITDITCIDLSPVAVDRMQKRLQAKGYTGIKVIVADMLKLPFGEESFDVVIEKGTMDVLFVDSGDPWNPRQETVNKVTTMLKEVHRVLKKDGIFISISFGQPHFRRPLFEAPEFTWSIEYNTFGDGFHYFFYVLKKGCGPYFALGHKLHPIIYNSLKGRRLIENVKRCEKSLKAPSINLYQEELEDEDYLFRTNVEELDS